MVNADTSGLQSKAIGNFSLVFMGDSLTVKLAAVGPAA